MVDYGPFQLIMIYVILVSYAYKRGISYDNFVLCRTG